MPTDTDWAYLAGLIDGEGHVGIDRRNKRPASFRIRLQVTNTYLPALLEVQAIFGGIVKQKGGKTPERCRKCYIWEICRADLAVEIIRGCLPYFKIKRAQAALVLEFPSHVRTNQYTPETPVILEKKMRLHQESMRINLRGPIDAMV